MYRGRPPPRGGHPPPPRPYPAQGYRDDRSRPRPPYHPGYHDHAHPDPYRRSPPRRRYPSPGSGSHRGGEYWSGGPPRESSPSPRGPIPLDRNLVITVGNKLTGPPGSAPSRHHDRDYPPRPEYERSRSPDRSRAKSRGRSKSRPRSQSRSPDRSRAKSRGRSKSRPRSQSRSPDRSRAKSRGRSKSRPRSQSRSPGRSRAKSRGRSKSRPRSQSRSPDCSQAKSKSRPHNRSSSRSRSRSRSIGRSRGRSYSKAASRGRSRSRHRSRSRSVSSSSSSGDDGSEKSRKEFKELQTARRRKELEEMLSLPTKSILKKRNDSEDSPSLRSSDSPRGLEASNICRVADQLLLAVKGTEPHRVASMLAELRSDPRMAQRAGLDAEIKEILNLLGVQAAGVEAQEKAADDIDDEEKFLYGDSEEPKPPPVSEPVQHHVLDLYGDVTEEALYGDYPPQKPVTTQTYGLPPEASSHLQVPPTIGEVDVRYASRPAISPDRHITVQVSNPAYPPGMEPLEESERQALEEYEKIQDLLKTIGLDLGVADISKMAARTKERLHGNKPPPKTPTRRRRYSSGSSDGSRRSQGRRRRSHSSSPSSSSSGSRSRGRGGSWSSDDSHRKSLAPPTTHRDVKEPKVERSDAAPTPPPQKLPDPKTLPPPHPGVPIPNYPPPQVHGMMPPNFPPPHYGQYGNYLPYMHQQWPPMYPPPNMTLPPQTRPDEFPPTLPYKQALNRVAPEPGAKALVKSCVQDAEKGKVSSHDRRVSEEQNNESQKQKVLEEREKLKQERETRMKKKEYLMKELERLRKQQGELLRKKRREKGGHKDPLLQEISHLQEEVMTQISNLRKEHEAAEKKRSEIDKVALILGLSPSDRPRGTSRPAEVQEAEPPPPEKKREAERSPERRQAASNSIIKQTSALPPSLRASQDEPPVSAPAPPPAPPTDPFEYYDAGNHWCKNCNVTSGSMFDFFTHLHSKSHRKTLDPYDRPWASTPTKTAKNTRAEEKLTKPAKGSEFLLPVRGFFCLLCKEFYGDAICAEEHVTTHTHNEKYKKQMYENPLYEQRRNLDRQAGLASETSGKKRKHEDDEKGNKDKEEKSKPKKEKRDKEKKKEEDDTILKEEKSKVKKEEEKPKLSKKEEDFKDAKSLEEERPSYTKKDEDEKSKYSKKDDKYRVSREEEERGKYSRREEEYRYRYRRDENDKYDDRPKYGPREDEDKYKYCKYSDFRPKYDREREGKPNAEKEAFKKLEPGKPAVKPAGKPEVSKPEPLPKPYDPPKIFSGPSPAMRAKLRKQSLEASKPALVAPTPSFGKFMWKKRENILAKEAEKVAAEFIKDDEAAAKQNPVLVEDCFAKSLAVAKEIAQKLGDQPSQVPPWVSNSDNRGRIRPNLPAPAAVLRKTAMMGKPAPLNTFLSIRPQNTSLQGYPKDGPPVGGPGPIEVVTAPGVARQEPFEVNCVPPVSEPAVFEGKPAPPVSKLAVFEGKLAPSVSGPASFEVNSTPPVSKPALFEVNSAPPVSKPALFEVNSAPPVSKPASFEVNSAPPVSKPASFEVNSAPPVSKPASFEVNSAPPVSKAAPSVVKSAQPTMIKIVSDVAAPGVPESEQTRTVFVKPPPFMTKSNGAQKSEKLKSNLAAAKAQDLFDIFYSSAGQSGSSSITKPATDTGSDRSSNNKSQLLPTPQAQKQQPQPLTQSQPPTVVCLSPQPGSDSSPSPQNQPESDIQIASVWSLQSTPIPTSEVASSKTSQTSQPKLNPPAQSEAQSLPQKQSSAPKSESQLTPPTEPDEPQPKPQTLSQPKLTPQIQTEPQSQSQPDQDTPSHPETHPDAALEPEPKPSPKARGKAAKRAPPAPRPVRQTRYQTRRQQQSQSEPEPEPASGDSDSAASDLKGLDTSDLGSGLHLEEGAPSEGDPQMMEITPENLGLPSDMTSLDFDYNFNFE